MAENNQNEPTYDVTSHTAKKGRSRTYVLKDLKGVEKGVLEPGRTTTAEKENNIAGLGDKARKNLFKNDYAGNPLLKNYSYDGFSVGSQSHNTPAIGFVSYEQHENWQDGVEYRYYFVKAHKKFEPPNLAAFLPGAGQTLAIGNPLPSSEIYRSSQDFLTRAEVLLPRNKINIEALGNGTATLSLADNISNSYTDSYGTSYDFAGEYKTSGLFELVTNNTSLVDLPSRDEYIYYACELPEAFIYNNANGNNQFAVIAPSNYYSAEEKIARNFLNKKHLIYVLTGQQSITNADLVNLFLQSEFLKIHLPVEDQLFLIPGTVVPQTTLDAIQSRKAYFFDIQKMYTHMDFISDIPFSPLMAQAAGIATEKMLTAEITSQFNFMPLALSEIVSSNDFLELELPNFYNFITALVATKEKKFNPFSLNAKRLSLNGRIDPSLLLLIGKQYAEYQAASELPPGHSAWDYDNNTPLLETYLDNAGVSYWQAWSDNWQDYNNEKNAGNEAIDESLNPRKTILIPYENTNFLTDYNENIEYFPQYNQIEFDVPKEAPIVPMLLKNAMADKYVMRCLAGHYAEGGSGTLSLVTFGPITLQKEDNILATFEANKDSPPGEDADLKDPDVKELIDAGGDPYGADGLVSPTVFDNELRSWDLVDLINGFKSGDEGWIKGGIEFFDQKAFYVGIDKEEGYPFAGDLSKFDSSQTFLKSLHAYMLEQQLQALAAQKIISYADIQCGAKNYSEIIMFRINKQNVLDGAATEQNIWMWNTGHIDRYIYYDTQIGYGQTYKYRIYAYHLVVGNRYQYRSISSKGISYNEDLEHTPQSLNKTMVEIPLVNQAMLKIVEVPYFGHEEKSQSTIVSTDRPPVAPDVTIVPFKNVSDSVSITLKTNSGQYETNKIVTLLSERASARDVAGGDIVNYLYASDNDVLQQMFESQNKVNESGLEYLTPSIEFKSDTLPAFYEIFRIGPEQDGMTKPPTSYASFFDKLHNIVEVDGSSITVLDDIEENTTYYYTFRARDGASSYFFSNPTAVYKVQLIKEPGKNVVYPVIEIYDMEMDRKYKMPSKQMTRYMHIKPAYEHTLIDEGNEETGLLDSVAYFQDKTTANSGHIPHVPKLGVNNDNYELFSVVKNNAKRFKIRLTSKSTGRKIDFNIDFLRKHNQD